jgi:putative ABC transport system permease protein
MFLSLKIALSSLAAHKLRAALAVLGIFLGALALTAVQHVSQAMVRKAQVEIEKLGPNLFMATAGQVRLRRSGSARFSGDARTFTVQDAVALARSMPAARLGAPFATATMPVRHGDIKVDSQLVATWPEYREVRNVRPRYGRFITQQDVEDLAKVCVLGKSIAERLFVRPEAAVGQTVFFFRAPSTVVGVMEEKGADIAGTDQDEQVFVPLSTYLRRFANQNWISGVYLQLAPGADPDQAKETATAILRQRHSILPGEEDDFGVLAARDTIQLQRQALDLVQTLGLISSTISFAVGGLGILSIMVLLVRARRLEIGVRRATGARRRDIVRQFLFESGLMSVAGGGLGVLASLGLLAAVYRLGDFPWVLDPLIMAGTLAASALLGLAAGAYPAWQASRLEILDVLRSE